GALDLLLNLATYSGIYGEGQIQNFIEGALVVGNHRLGVVRGGGVIDIIFIDCVDQLIQARFHAATIGDVFGRGEQGLNRAVEIPAGIRGTALLNCAFSIAEVVVGLAEDKDGFRRTD